MYDGRTSNGEPEVRGHCYRSLVSGTWDSISTGEENALRRIVNARRICNVNHRIQFRQTRKPLEFVEPSALWLEGTRDVELKPNRLLDFFNVHAGSRG